MQLSTATTERDSLHTTFLDVPHSEPRGGWCTMRPVRGEFQSVIAGLLTEKQIAASLNLGRTLQRVTVAGGR